MQGELAQVQWVSLHMQGASFPLHPLPPCPNPRLDPAVQGVPVKKKPSVKKRKRRKRQASLTGLTTDGIQMGTYPLT